MVIFNSYVKLPEGKPNIRKILEDQPHWFWLLSALPGVQLLGVPTLQSCSGHHSLLCHPGSPRRALSPLWSGIAGLCRLVLIIRYIIYQVWRYHTRKLMEERIGCPNWVHKRIHSGNAKHYKCPSCVTFWNFIQLHMPVHLTINLSQGAYIFGFGAPTLARSCGAEHSGA